MTATTSKPVSVSKQNQMISLALIDRPSYNPRKKVSPQPLEELAASIAACGVLQPPIVRPRNGRFEIVIGERRYRACQMLGLKEIECRVMELDDRKAREAQLVENLERDDLDALEIADALSVLKSFGHDDESLARLISVDEATIAARIGILELPEAFQDMLRKGEISGPACELLLPWRKYPAILSNMERVARNSWPMPLSAWRRTLIDSVRCNSRSMEADAPDGPRFKISPDVLKRLDVQLLELKPGSKVKRAMNVDLWDDLADRHEQGDSVPASPPAAPPAPSRANNSPKTAAIVPATRSTAGKSSAPSAKAAVVLAGPYGAPVNSDAQFAEKLAAFKANWLREKIAARLESATIPELEATAVAAGLDVEAAWSLSRPFLELFDDSGLDRLARELAVDLDDCRDTREKIVVLSRCAVRRVPSVFLKAGRTEPTAD